MTQVYASASITADQYADLLHIVSGRSNLPLAIPLSVALAKHLPDAEISTRLRIAHFLGQASCETYGFTRLKEWDGGNPHYFDQYEGRKILGNTEAGDGARFCGRGLFDTTGRYNYRVLHTLTGLDCVNHPKLLEQPEAAVFAAVQFWTHHGCNQLADKDDLPSITKTINGGLNGLADRKIFTKRAMGALQ